MDDRGDPLAKLYRELNSVRETFIMEVASLRKEIASLGHFVYGDKATRPSAVPSRATTFVIVSAEDDPHDEQLWMSTWVLGSTQVDATWTREAEEAHVFTNRDVARLVAHCAGGVMKSVQATGRRKRRSR